MGIFRESAAAAVFATLGIVLGAWYMLNLFRKAFAGPLDRAENRTLPDLRRREALILLPLVILMFVFGILPNLILRPTDAVGQRSADPGRGAARGADGCSSAQAGRAAGRAYGPTGHVDRTRNSEEIGWRSRSQL